MRRKRKQRVREVNPNRLLRRNTLHCGPRLRYLMRRRLRGCPST